MKTPIQKAIDSNKGGHSKQQIRKAFKKLAASKDYKRDFTNIDEYHER